MLAGMVDGPRDTVKEVVVISAERAWWSAKGGRTVDRERAA
jgi:hypothetical protein